MIQFEITKVEPYIFDFKQFFRLYFNTRRTADFTHTSRSPLKVEELELLLGSFVVPVYFEDGEPNLSSRLATINKKAVKSWRIKLNGSVEELRKKNRDLLLNFEIVRAVSVLSSYNDLLHLYVKEQSESYLFTVSQLRKLSGLKQSEFERLEGALIAPVFYMYGEIGYLYGYPLGNHQDYNNTKVKNLNLRLTNAMTKT